MKIKGFRGGIIGGESHHSGIADLGEKLDPTSYLFNSMGSFGKKINPHTYLKPIATTSNKYLSKITKPLNQFETKINPLHHYLHDNVGFVKSLDETVENRPVDAAAIAAGLFFSGGALAGAMGGAGAAGAGAAGAAGTSGAALAAPAASSAAGIGGMSAGMGASAITPAFASGVGAVAPSTMGAIGGGSLLGTAGTGTLGAAGTAALGSTFATPASMGGVGLATTGSNSLFNSDNIQQAIKTGNQLNDQNNQQTTQPYMQTPQMKHFQMNHGGSQPYQPMQVQLGNTAPTMNALQIYLQQMQQKQNQGW